MGKLLKKLAQDLVKRGKIKVHEGSIDGSFSAAKKGVLELVKQSTEKGARS